MVHKNMTTVLTFGMLCCASMMSGLAHSEPGKEAILKAIKQSSVFMMDSVSDRGGFVRLYTENLSEKWGEVPARASMVWVQSPGTVSVGEIFLNAYQVTGDPLYLDYCDRIADTLIWGQHASGGWHYFIDFDPAATEAWYQRIGTQCWGWEEFYHFYDNSTFDDNTTTGAATYLLNLFKETKKPKYEKPLRKVIQFILDAQYPLGGWPQRFPLQTEHHPEPITDYTSYYTFNDGVTVGNIYFLLKAHELFGDEEIQRAAIRGMRFVALSQYGEPQPGWAQQFDLDLNPGGARNYEPASIAPSTTYSMIRQLLKFYRITGDTRFLRGIPSALDWLDRSTLPTGHSDDGHTHAQFIEVGSGKPLYAHREGKSVSDGRYWVDYEPKHFPGHYGMQTRVNVQVLRQQVEIVSSLSPEAAMESYRAEKENPVDPGRPSMDEVAKIIDALDKRGAWIEDLSVPDFRDWKNRPRREFRGISTATFQHNLRSLTSALSHFDNKN